MLGRSWKTTLAGILTLVGTGAKLALDVTGGHPPDIVSALTGVSAGVGLILGKDHNVGGLLK